ncbi:kinase-like domain-containing protein, partial [Gigaspora rosea]
HGDLRKFIDNSTLSWSERVKIISSIAKSLNELHNSDIIHRDLHCGNILVDDVDNDTKIFISDFGVSGPIDSPPKCIIGVLPYIAPEVFIGKTYTKKSDIYSLGVIMWELTSSERPFSDRIHDIDLVSEITYENLRPKVVERTLDVYKNIMEQCWNAGPSERPDLSVLI